jgi:hypothetical protein
VALVYVGPYTEEIGADEHEGHTARLYPGGRVIDTDDEDTSPPDTDVISHIARCSCGWRSNAVYPPTPNGEQAARSEWDQDHLRPLVYTEAQQHTILASRLIALSFQLRARAFATGHGGQELTALSEHGQGLCDAADSLDRLLSETAEHKQ